MIDRDDSGSVDKHEMKVFVKAMIGAWTIGSLAHKLHSGQNTDNSNIETDRFWIFVKC